MRRFSSLLAVVVLASCQVTPSPSPSAGEPGSMAPSPVSSPISSPSAPASPAAAPSGSIDEVATGPIRWRRLTSPVGSCHVTTVTARRDGSLLAICQTPSDDVLHGLRSNDGLSWASSDLSGIPATTPRRVTLVKALAEAPDGRLVAVGADALEDLSSGDAATWTSTDGRSWVRGPASDVLADAEMRDVVATPSGFIAAGADGYPGANVQLPGLRAAAVWTSRDGVHWRRSAPPDGRDRLVEGIGRTSDGWVAWGGAAPPASGVAWTSADGQTWSLARAPGGGAWGPIGRIVTTGIGLVAVGAWTTVANTGDELTTSGLWGSTESGRSWTVTPISVDPTLGPLWDVVAAGTQLVATGANGLVMTSADSGATWSWQPTDPAGWLVRLSPLVVAGPRIVGFGSEETDSGTLSSIWTGTLAP